MNKYSLSALLIILLPLYMFTQPVIQNVQQEDENNQVELFDKLELRFHLNEYANNYSSEMIRVDGTFISPSGKTYKVPGFYYVDYIKETDFNCKKDILCESLKKNKAQAYNWVIRFTPNEPGTWKYTITAQDEKGQDTFPEKERKSFTCIESDRTGFITKNNNRYLKKGDKPVFMAGTNIAWYGRDSFDNIPVHELGTNDYKRYIDILAQNKANFLRLWINYSAGISLVGREWTTGEMYTFTKYNQKDAWQLDRIINEANNKDINIVLSLLQQNAFVNSYGVNNWSNNNAYNKKIKGNRSAPLENPFDIFSNQEAIRQTKDLFRYIIARWGYATNIISWELWNEVEQVEKIWQKAHVSIPENYYEHVINWHNQMADFIRKTDPFGHLVSTSSPNKYTDRGKLFPDIWYKMDLTISHDYQSYKNLSDFKRFETHLLNRANGYINNPKLNEKPYMSQEWGVTPGNNLAVFDPNGYAYHCCLWASCMTASFGAVATWEWDKYILKQNLFTYLYPVSVFMNSVVDQLDGTTRGYRTHTKEFTVFYATTSSNNIFIGWCQNDNYDFSAVKNTKYIQNLKSDRPKPHRKKNRIKLPVNKNNQAYTVRWYETQNAQMVQEETVRSKGYKIKFLIPQALRTSAFGDGAFIITSGAPSDPVPSEGPPVTGTTPKRIRL